MSRVVRHHLFSIRVENKSRVLVRVAGLFARRGFNIVSLAVAPTADERFSRISIVVDADSAPLQQVRDQLDKLVNVVEITEIEPGAAQEVELGLVCVKDAAGALRTVLDEYGAEVIDEQPGVVVVKLAGRPSEIDALTDALTPFGIVELQRTGRVAIKLPS